MMEQKQKSTQRKYVKRTDNRKTKQEPLVNQSSQSLILLGQKLKLIEEREEWSNEFAELERQLEKKLCISQTQEEKQKDLFKVEINEKQNPNLQLKCEDLCNVNFSFNEELPILQMIERVADDAFSFGQAEQADQPERFSFFSFAQNEFPINSNIEEQDLIPDNTFNPQNYTVEQLSQNQSMRKGRRRIFTRSFNTMKHMHNKKIHKNIRDGQNHKSFIENKFFLRIKTSLKQSTNNQIITEI